MTKEEKEESNKRKHQNEEEEDNDDDDNYNAVINNNDDHDNEENNEEEKTKRKRKRKRKKKGNHGDEEQGNNKDDKNAKNNVDKLNSLDYTVYVEGIPFDCTEEEVKHFFIENGCDDVLQLRLPKWQDTGRLRGFGHVVFDSTESKSRALSELNGKNLKKRYLTIQEAKPSGGGGGAGGAMNNGNNNPRPQPDDCRTIFIKNLPYDNITEDDILHVFRSCGKIVDGGVRLARNSQTNHLKGFGYVEFKNPEGAYSAVQRAAKGDGIKVGGRVCYVDYDESTMKGSFRTAEGKLWKKQHGSSGPMNNRHNNRFKRY